MVRLLLSRGAEVNVVSRNGWTALMIAAAKGYATVARVLLRHGARPAIPDIYGWTPLMRAVYAGHADVVRLLLESRRAEVNARDEHGDTALHRAAERGDLDSIRLLLRYGADPALRDAEGLTPAQIAAASGHEAVAALLAQKRRREEIHQGTHGKL